MTLWWIGDVLLLVVILPVVILLLSPRAGGRQGIVPSVQRSPVLPRRVRRTSTPPPLLVTTRDQVDQTVAGVAGYGGSLDVIIDDAD